MEPQGYKFNRQGMGLEHAYLLPAVDDFLKSFDWQGRPKRLFDLGCGNGCVADHYARQGYAVTGVDPSQQGIELARQNFPTLALAPGSSDDDLSTKYGLFPVVISLEVVEHVYNPKRFAHCVFDLLEPGGMAVISTPYHGYWKNLALALSGKMDHHFTALWDHGHIKFWSVATLSELLREAGFADLRVKRVGRVKALAKSMVMAARKPMK